MSTTRQTTDDNVRRVGADSDAGRAGGGRRRRSRNGKGPRERSAAAGSNLLMVVIGGLFLLPLAWVVLASIDPAAGLTVAWPENPSGENYAAIWNAETTFRPIFNSLVLCGGATLIATVCSILCAYPLSRYTSRWNRPFLLTIIFATGLPITAIMIPVYSLYVQVNLIDSMVGAILFLAASSMPYGIFLTKGFMDSVPLALEESAWTEGATTGRTLWSVVLPMMRPGMAVVTIFMFVQMWGNFFVPFMLLLTPDKLPAAVTLYTFSSQYGQVAYGQLAAFSILYSLPVVILYLFIGRRLGTGFVGAGGLKG